MAILVSDVESIIANLQTLYRYASGTSVEKKFHDTRIKNGKVFVTARVAGSYLFAPSKFAGYQDNDLRHEEDLDNRDGRATNHQISSLIGPEIGSDDPVYEQLDREFIGYCASFAIEPSKHPKERRYWLVDIAPAADEAIVVDNFREGSLQRVYVNRYERNPVARRICLAQHGYNCAVCEMSFASRYGRLGEGFIHVHHITPISTIGEAYVIDPVRDLRPVCPNCHAMLHRNSDVMSIEELRTLLS